MAVDSKKRNHHEDPQVQQPLRSERILGSSGFCRLWILGLLSWHSPPYEAQGRRKLPLTGLHRWRNAFDEIKAALLNAPTLVLPDVTKPSHLYVDEKKGVAKGATEASPWPMEVAGDLI